jgi:cell pole-organizing protein PopZ
MATASNAQREPSMEEILASIRRIIEDSDGGRRPPAGEEEADAAVEAVHEADTAANAPEVAAFRAQLREEDEASRPARPITLADVQRQLASEPVPPGAGARPASEADTSRSVTLADVGARIAAENAGDAEPEEAEAAGQGDVSLDADELKPEAGTGEPAQAASHTVEAGAAAGADFMRHDAAADDLPASRPALVSEQTSRQVAAAFGELSEAFASRGRKSFDEMAEEMLRPMLQDWLDNNLPTLVERLVREEIERVARGTA